MSATSHPRRVALVTGGSSGIGRATALRFSEDGYQVVVWDRTPSDPVPNGTFQAVDITDSTAVNQAVEILLAKYGRLDVLINNAGILRDGQLVKFKDGELLSVLSDDQFNAVIDVNLKGVFHCTRAAAPAMIEAKGGVILNASSVVGLYGNFGQTNYIASKAGVIGMTKVWARELGKYNIRVNAVAPGFIETEMVRQMPEKILQTMRDHTPLGRLGSPLDIANTYLWLASPAASFITGAVISVDGGIVTGT